MELSLLLVNRLKQFLLNTSDYFLKFFAAITHMRWKNDENLCKRVPGIDLVLGGIFNVNFSSIEI
jgi:hypothetical protein